MTRAAGRAGSAGVRFLLSAAAVAGTLVVFASLAEVAHVDAPTAGRATVAPVPSVEPVDVNDTVEVKGTADVHDTIDVTASASGRARGRR